MIRAWDLTTHAPKWTYRITKTWEPIHLVPLGTNGVLAFGNPSRLIRPDSIDPSVDLSLSIVATNFVPSTNYHFQVHAKIRNHSTLAPRGAYLDVILPPGLRILDSATNRIPLGHFFDETNITFYVSATIRGEHQLRIVAANDLPDSASSNNVWEQTIIVPPSPILLLENIRTDEASQIHFELSSPAGEDNKVDYSVELLTATGGDLTTMSGTLRFQFGTRSVGLSLTSADRLHESDETFRIHFHSTNVTLLRDSIDVTIVDDDVATLTGGATFIERHSGTNDAAFTVHLNSGSQAPIDLYYEILSGSATAGIDFVASAGTLHFAPDESSKTIYIPVMGDTEFEPNETVFVNLRGTAGVFFQPYNGFVTIENDDSRQRVTLQLTKPRIGPAILSFQTIPGMIYEIQHRTNLAQGTWTRTNLNVTSIGATATAEVPPGFFRVISR